MRCYTIKFRRKGDKDIHSASFYTDVLDTALNLFEGIYKDERKNITIIFAGLKLKGKK